MTELETQKYAPINQAAEAPSRILTANYDPATLRESEPFVFVALHLEAIAWVFSIFGGARVVW